MLPPLSEATGRWVHKVVTSTRGLVISLGESLLSVLDRVPGWSDSSQGRPVWCAAPGWYPLPLAGQARGPSNGGWARLRRGKGRREKVKEKEERKEKVMSKEIEYYCKTLPPLPPTPGAPRVRGRVVKVRSRV